MRLNRAVVVGLDLDEWVLIKPFIATRSEISVPAGFVTDFASIPRFFWRVLPPHGRIKEPAIVHDYLYAIDHDKKAADLEFKKLMKVYRVTWWRRVAAYHAVRVFGSKRKSIEQFKKRGLLKTPEDYLTS